MRDRAAAGLGSLLFFVIAPGTVAGYVPWLLSNWQLQPSPPAARMAGIALAVAGVGCVLECFARFALQGRGTPAPVAPTETLVVTGLYRHVRNPMYVGVVSTILGQALVFGDWRLLAYAAAIAGGFHAFVVGYEEPHLTSRFGASYVAYRRAVRRWWPRLVPWQG